MNGFVNGSRTPEEQFFEYRLSFGIKGINIDDLPYVIHLCFLLHNFCEINKKVINSSCVEAAKKFDSEF